MAHFCKLGIGNLVEQVIVVSDDIATTEEKGIEFLHDLYGTNEVWKQTSYSGSFRKNFASIGYYYNQTLDAFIPPKPFSSWILDENTCLWNPPKEKPELTEEQIDNNSYYVWNELLKKWELVE